MHRYPETHSVDKPFPRGGWRAKCQMPLFLSDILYFLSGELVGGWYYDREGKERREGLLVVYCARVQLFGRVWWCGGEVT